MRKDQVSFASAFACRVLFCTIDPALSYALLLEASRHHGTRYQRERRGRREEMQGGRFVVNEATEVSIPYHEHGSANLKPNILIVQVAVSLNKGSRCLFMASE